VCSSDLWIQPVDGKENKKVWPLHKNPKFGLAEKTFVLAKGELYTIPKDKEIPELFEVVK